MISPKAFSFEMPPLSARDSGCEHTWKSHPERQEKAVFQYSGPPLPHTSPDSSLTLPGPSISHSFSLYHYC